MRAKENNRLFKFWIIYFLKFSTDKKKSSENDKYDKNVLPTTLFPIPNPHVIPHRGGAINPRDCWWYCGKNDDDWYCRCYKSSWPATAPPYSLSKDLLQCKKKYVLQQNTKTSCNTRCWNINAMNHDISHQPLTTVSPRMCYNVTR